VIAMLTPSTPPERTRRAQGFEPLTPHSGRVRGLGDVIARITSFFGIKPCEPCARRAEALNAMVPFEKSEQESETQD
jgi:hypothetical protein